jgi:hypothetical protein
VLRLPDLRIPRRRRRSAAEKRRRARPAARADRSPRARPIAAAVLIAALTVGWLAAGHRSRAAGSSAPVTPSSTATPPASSNAPADRICAPASGAGEGEVRCVLDGVRVDIRTYPPGTGAAAYRRASGVAARPHDGPPACARGEPDERAWSDPAAPTVAVGRYRCVLEAGRAAMWWTRGDRLAHAVSADSDLAALFAWWRTHPAE